MTRIYNLIGFSIVLSFALSYEMNSRPIVTNWEDAVTDDGLVRIPLQNPKGHAWFASL